MPENTGSFGGSAQKIEGMIREKKTAEALQQHVNKTAEEAEQKEQTRIEKEVESQLPKFIDSGILGRVSYDRFKDQYTDVWEQVADKQHFLSRRVTYETEKPMPIKIQSMTQNERRAMELWAPTSLMSQTEFREASMDYSILRLVIQLQRVDDQDFPDVPLSPKDREEWRKDSAVQQMFDIVYGWDDQFVTFLLELTNDLDQAKYLALVENLKNP